MTSERVTQYMRGMDLEKLSPEERAKALQALIDKLNALSKEERRKWRFDNDWFRGLLEDEKARFLEAIMPAEIKLALNAFEQLPKEKRRESIDKALEELRAQSADAADPNDDANAKPFLSPELETQVKTMGLRTLYSDSSAQTKAELAPLLLEVQHQFETGRLGRMKGF